MNPGIYQNISFAEYNALPYLRNSYLKKLSICPASAQIETNGTTTALTIGRASHALILEGEAAFNKEFMVAPADAPKKPTSAQINAKKPSAAAVHSIQWWNQFNTLAHGKEIISAEDYAMLQGMDRAVKTHPFAKTLLAEGVSEQTVVADIEVDGEMIRCKSRPDRTPSTKMACMIDLKSCADASYRGFLNACYRFSYFHQAADYIECYNSALEVMINEHGWSREENPPMDAFVFIAIEKEPPYRCEVYTLQGDNNLLIQGREDFYMNLRTEVQCRKQGFYPHYLDAGAQELLPFNER